MSDTATADPQTGYAEVNGLRMYYEIHGGDREGTPVLLLNGANIRPGTSGPLLPGLAAERQVIVADSQAQRPQHGCRSPDHL